MDIIDHCRVGAILPTVALWRAWHVVISIQVYAAVVFHSGDVPAVGFSGIDPEEFSVVSDDSPSRPSIGVGVLGPIG